MLELFPGSTHYLNTVFPIVVYSSEIFIERYLSGKKNPSNYYQSSKSEAPALHLVLTCFSHFLKDDFLMSRSATACLCVCPFNISCLVTKRSFSVKIISFSFTFLRIYFEDKLKGS